MASDMIRISDFKRAVNEYFILTREDSSKKYLCDYSYLLLNSIERDNELLKDSLSERHYRESFFTTMMSSLFHDYTQDMATFYREKCLFASAEDYGLKKDDSETQSTGRKIDIVWCIEPIKLEFAIGEISSSPNQRCHSHFFDDKLKIAKMLKVMLNKIVRTYGGNSSMLNHLNLYGVQAYNKKENESIEAENIPIVVDNEVLESLMKEMIVGSVKYMIGSFDVEKALISDFKRAVNEYFILTREDSSKKYLWDYSYLLLNSIERDNELLKDSLSERHYRESFFTTMMSSLFHDYTQDMATFYREKCLFASAEDYGLKKDDSETQSTGRKIDIVWCIEPIKLEFAIGEISSSPNQRCHSHFFDDKLKIAKMLKVMLNKIVRTYGGNSSMLNHLNLYGVQAYSQTLSRRTEIVYYWPTLDHQSEILDPIDMAILSWMLPDKAMKKRVWNRAVCR
ncbi:737_t:CDS:10 [Entrophospora sp. SA101]|nr:737_t:CDS:10 [Entrophospora sp. SA101]